jgi:hypothetical protein
MINENEIFRNELLKNEKNEIITIYGEWWNLGKRKYIVTFFNKKYNKQNI